MNVTIDDLPLRIHFLAIKNQKMQGNRMDGNQPLINNRIEGNFDWNETPEGGTFWDSINTSLNTLLREAETLLPSLKPKDEKDDDIIVKKKT